MLLVWPELRLGAGRAFLLGVLATQLGVPRVGDRIELSRRRRADENVLAAAALQMLFGGPVLAGCWRSLAASGPTLRFNPRTLGALVYLIVVGSIVGFSAYAYALKHLPVATVSLYAYVNPVIAVVLTACSASRTSWLASAELPSALRLSVARGRDRSRDVRRAMVSPLHASRSERSMSDRPFSLGAACAAA